MNVSTLLRGTLAAGAFLLFGATAQASYYVRPMVIIGDEVIDGYVADGPTSSSQHFTTDYESTVDLSNGTVKSYLNTQGPGSYAQVVGTFGDQIIFSPNAVGTTADVSFDFDGRIMADAPLLNGAALPQLGLLATLYVYEAGSGVNYLNYGAAQFDPFAVVSQSMFLSFNPEAAFDEIINDGLFGSFTIGSGSYDIFTGLSIFALTQQNPINVEMDFLNTGTFGIRTDPGVTFTSASGVLLTGVTSAIPEPATWAMMITGFGLVGATVRRRRQSRPVVTA